MEKFMVLDGNSLIQGIPCTSPLSNRQGLLMVSWDLQQCF